MELTPVDSSMMSAAGYDPETRELRVAFKCVRIYTYTGVSQEEFNALMAADSKGRHMQSHVIGRYPFYRGARRRKSR